MAEGAADGGERDARVAAAGLHHHVPAAQLAPLPRAPQDVQRHAVLDAACRPPARPPRSVQLGKGRGGRARAAAVQVGCGDEGGSGGGG